MCARRQRQRYNDDNDVNDGDDDNNNNNNKKRPDQFNNYFIYFGCFPLNVVFGVLPVIFFGFLLFTFFS